MSEPRSLPPLSNLTTLRLGGPPLAFVRAGTDAAIIAALSEAGGPVLLVGGGSNLVVADEGFPGLVIQIDTKGIVFDDRGPVVRVTAAAGEPWDDLVAACVAKGLRGLECLSGIPGTVGAVPLQNVGAYGQEVSDTVVSVRTFDRVMRCTTHVPAQACAFGYRTSAFRGWERHVVLDVTFELAKASSSVVPDYAELRRALGLDRAESATEAPIALTRKTVLALRGQKGMVLDPNDPDSVSAGSFFTNPLLEDAQVATLREAVLARLGPGVSPPLFLDAPSGRTKTSAAWLIERAGFEKGYGVGRAGLSSKHTLALVNRGGATTRELLDVAVAVRRGVLRTFGVTLHPEPIFVGFSSPHASDVLAEWAPVDASSFGASPPGRTP